MFFFTFVKCFSPWNGEVFLLFEAPFIRKWKVSCEKNACLAYLAYLNTNSPLETFLCSLNWGRPLKIRLSSSVKSLRHIQIAITKFLYVLLFSSNRSSYSDDALLYILTSWGHVGDILGISWGTLGAILGISLKKSKSFGISWWYFGELLGISCSFKVC